MEGFLDKPINERKVKSEASEAGVLKFSEKISSLAEMIAFNPQVATISFISAIKFMIASNTVADQGNVLKLRMAMPRETS